MHADKGNRATVLTTLNVHTTVTVLLKLANTYRMRVRTTTYQVPSYKIRLYWLWRAAYKIRLYWLWRAAYKIRLYWLWRAVYTNIICALPEYCCTRKKMFGKHANTPPCMTHICCATSRQLLLHSVHSILHHSFF
jgi:hypothetical protein